jgi:hypothetical protein
LFLGIPDVSWQMNQSVYEVVQKTRRADFSSLLRDRQEKNRFQQYVASVNSALDHRNVYEMADILFPMYIHAHFDHLLDNGCAKVTSAVRRIQSSRNDSSGERLTLCSPRCVCVSCGSTRFVHTDQIGDDGGCMCSLKSSASTVTVSSSSASHPILVTAAASAELLQTVTSKIEMDGIAVGMHLKAHASHCLPLFLFIADYSALRRIQDKEAAEHAMGRLKQAYFTKGSRCALYGLGEVERTWRIQQLAAEETAVDRRRRTGQKRWGDAWMCQRRRTPYHVSQCCSLDPILTNAFSEAAVLLHPHLPSSSLLRCKKKACREPVIDTAPLDTAPLDTAASSQGRMGGGVDGDSDAIDSDGDIDAIDSNSGDSGAIYRDGADSDSSTDLELDESYGFESSDEGFESSEEEAAEAEDTFDPSTSVELGVGGPVARSRQSILPTGQEKRMQSFVGTPGYMAPEIYNARDKKVEAYDKSVGMRQ